MQQINADTAEDGPKFGTLFVIVQNFCQLWYCNSSPIEDDPAAAQADARGLAARPVEEEARRSPSTGASEQCSEQGEGGAVKVKVKMKDSYQNLN